MTQEVFGFVDGENLILRYEDMLKSGSTPKPSVIHIPGLLVWHPDITNRWICNFNRITFYQTFFRDQKTLDDARMRICDT